VCLSSGCRVSTERRPSDETDQRVKPPALNSLRLTHLFKGPSCYCAWLQGGRYTEAKIGLALRTGGPSGISDACLGQFVAICAEQRCGYFGEFLNGDFARSIRILTLDSVTQCPSISSTRTAALRRGSTSSGVSTFPHQDRCILIP
jgi:hypothetical protein